MGGISRGRGRAPFQVHRAPNTWQEEELLSASSANQPQRRRHAAGDQSTTSAAPSAAAPASFSLPAFNFGNLGAATTSPPTQTTTTTSTTTTTNTTASSAPSGANPAQPQAQQLPQNMMFGLPNAGPNSGPAGLNSLIGNILASQLQNRGGPGGVSDNQHIRVNIGGIPGQISIQTITAQSNDSGQPGVYLNI